MHCDLWYHYIASLNKNWQVCLFCFYSKKNGTEMVTGKPIFQENNLEKCPMPVHTLQYCQTLWSAWASSSIDMKIKTLGQKPISSWFLERDHFLRGKGNSPKQAAGPHAPELPSYIPACPFKRIFDSKSGKLQCLVPIKSGQRIGDM